MGRTDWLVMIGKMDTRGALLTSEAAESPRTCEALLDGYAKRVFDARAGNR